jgi:protoheme IX farnesyltransferase
MDSKTLTAQQTIARRGAGILRNRLGLYAVLTKVRLASLVLFTTFVGFVMGGDGSFRSATLVATLIGTLLCALGAGALNQWMEVRQDRCMEYTRHRPLAASMLPTKEVLALATCLSVTGVGVLLLAVNVLTAGLALATVAVYLGVYTPAKLRTSLCTLIGAVSGAIPPMMGWAAATGELEAGAWVLGAILLVWQIPHALALAWLHRREYERAGFRMLSVGDAGGAVTSFMILIYALALLPVSLSAVLVGLAGWRYAVGALFVGAIVVLLSIEFLRKRTESAARRLFYASTMHLALLLGLMLADRDTNARVIPVVGGADTTQVADQAADSGEPGS